MSLEIKLLPQYQHLSSDGQSMILLDVRRGQIIEVDRITATIIEEGQRYGTFNDSVYESAMNLLELRGVASEDINLYVDKVKELIQNGFFPESEDKKDYDAVFNGIVLDVSQTCQLDCVYCFAGGGSYGNAELSPLMSTEIGIKAVDFFFSIANPDAKRYSITYFGGEPLLNWSLIQHLTDYAVTRSKAVGKEIGFSITTNGIGIDREKAQFMKDHNFSLLISIDGDQGLHNYLRPCRNNMINSYAATTDAVKHLSEVYDSISGRATITSKCSDPRRVYDMLKDAGITDPLCIMVGANSGKDLELSADEVREYTQGIVNLLHSDKGYVQRRIFLERVAKPNSVARTCGLGMSSIAVDSSGGIYGCHRLVANERYYVGSVHDGLIAERVNDLAKNVTAHNMLGCRTCWCRFFCGGTCPSESYESTGNHYFPDPRWCYVNQSLVEAAIEIYLSELKNDSDRKDRVKSL